MMNGDVNGRLKALIELAAKPPAKDVEGLSEVVHAMALNIIDMHIEMKEIVRAKESTKSMILTRIVAPLIVGGILYLLFTLGPAIIRHVPLP